MDSPLGGIMSDIWNQWKSTKEEAYFKEREQEALKRLHDRPTSKPRLSPVTGEPMEQVTCLGVVVDRCPSSGGIWLDADELQHLIATAKKEESEFQHERWTEKFFKFLCRDR